MSEACCGAGQDPCDSARHHGARNDDHAPWWRDGALALPLAAGVLWLTGLALQWRGHEGAATAAHAGALAAGAWTFAPSAVRQLWTARGRARLGVGLLMTIAASGAVALGHVGEAAALAFLFSIAETLEDRAMDRARHGLRALLEAIPPTARIAHEAGEAVVPAAQVRRGDVLVVGAGDRIATDGVVVAGRSFVDTSAVTGESVPAAIEPGSAVMAGCVNGTGGLRIEATADGRDNSLTQIVRLVEQAHVAKGERARLADRVARPLVPLLLITAGLIAAFALVTGEPLWIERALVVLVAASPCALAIAVPVTVISAIGAASRLGVVITSGAAFEHLGTVGRVAFDKTGTLTRNRPEVVDAEAVEGHTVDEILGWAAAVETASGHPLAEALRRAVGRPVVAHEVREHPGQGVSGRVGNRVVRVGSPRWIDSGALAARAEAMAQRGMSIVVVEADGEPRGVIGLRDELREEAAEAVAALHALRIETAMLTGDHELTARAIAGRAGIARVHAAQTPAAKAAWIAEAARSAPTAMIGDGINDAPALATATVGIAIGTTGSAAAVEAADIAFTGHDLRLIPRALRHARRGGAIMTANIVLALAIIVVLFPLALFGVLGLATVVLVHEIAEVIVIGNGLRAARVQRSERLTATITGR